MALYIYRRKPSTGAADLAEALDAIRFRGRTRPIEQKVRRGDAVVNWGETFVGAPDIKVLNGAPILNKYQDALKLREAGVSTIEVALRPPAIQLRAITPVDPAVEAFVRAREFAIDFGDLATDVSPRGPVFRDGAVQLQTALQTLLAELGRPAPAPVPVVQKTWIARKFDHVGGNDLLDGGTAVGAADYFAVKEEFVKEFRVHSFLGRSIRAGIKAPRPDFIVLGTGRAGDGVGAQDAHPWIRSWDGGWRIKYDGVSSKKKHRELAHAAVKALGLDFGAVDIGERADGTLAVLEVNRAPGLAEGTIDRYVTAIQGWMDGTTQPEV